MVKLIDSAVENLKTKLLDKGLMLKVAESFTGGFIASQITKIAGASQFFAEGLVCYSLDAKMHRLDVGRNVLDEFGAVSFATLKQMLGGLKGENVLAIATTGNAGPLIQNGEKGTCFVGASVTQSDKSFTVIKRLNLYGSRTAVIKTGGLEALKCALEVLDYTSHI